MEYSVVLRIFQVIVAQVKYKRVKCVEHEFRLQQAMEELKSVQLIVQMLRNEHIHEDHDAASVQQTGPDLVANNSLKEISKRSSQKHIKGKIELRNLVKKQITMTNQCAALESESNIYGEEFNFETTKQRL
jgi:arylamine N-acetyltransferase